MKKINLIEWLSRNSHEKQSPQRFARYAAMLLTILTLGTGQMWGNYAYLDLTGTTWWYNDDAVFRLDKNGSGNVDSYTEIPGTGVWRFDIGTYTGAATFKRMNSSRTDQWNYANVTIGFLQMSFIQMIIMALLPAQILSSIIFMVQTISTLIIR